VRISSDLTDDQIASMTDEELDAWAEAQAIGPWTPNDVPPAPPPDMTGLTVRLPRDLLAELEAEAALHRQPAQRYARDLLLLALRQVQAGRRHRR
jgi:hypothetical protein